MFLIVKRQKNTEKRIDWLPKDTIKDIKKKSRRLLMQKKNEIEPSLLPKSLEGKRERCCLCNKKAIYSLKGLDTGTWVDFKYCQDCLKTKYEWKHSSSVKATEKRVYEDCYVQFNKLTTKQFIAWIVNKIREQKLGGLK